MCAAGKGGAHLNDFIHCWENVNFLPLIIDWESGVFYEALLLIEY